MQITIEQIKAAYAEVQLEAWLLRQQVAALQRDRAELMKQLRPPREPAERNNGAAIAKTE